MSYEVVLAVYDLSRGMARSLSAQLLGPEFAVDAIPHTGIVAYGYEYFFGAGPGVQREEPVAFRQSRDLHPVQLIPLGRTCVPQAEFEDWCRQRSLDGSYAGSAYDLLRRNCNNFAHDAAREGLGLDQGVPEWILEVPRRFLASPVGMMMRPMFENMQLAGPTNSSSALPFTSSPPAAAAAAPLRASTTSVYSTDSVTAVPATNPWANLPQPTATSATASSSQSTRSVAALQTPEIVDTPAMESPTKKLRPSDSASEGPNGGNAASTPVLDSFASKPLLSSDSSTIPLCLKKLKGVLEGNEWISIEKASSIILEGSTNGVEAANQRSSHPNREYPLPPDLADVACQALLRALQSGKHESFALLLLRVLVLHLPPLGGKDTGGASNSSCAECLAWIRRELVEPSASLGATGGRAPLQSPAARAAAWLALSNALTVDGLVDRKALGSIVDAALVDWNPSVQPRVNVRQASSSFLYNVSLYLVSSHVHDSGCVQGSSNSHDNKDVIADDDMITSMICFGLDGLEDENDAACRLRRCMILGRLLLNKPPSMSKPPLIRGSELSASVNANAPNSQTQNESWHLRRSLAMELGIVTVLTSLVATASVARQSSPESAMLSRLAEELLTALV